MERFASVRAGNVELLGAVNIGYRVTDGSGASCNNARIQANRTGISVSGSIVVGTGSVDFSVGGTFFPTSNEDVDIANGGTVTLSTATFTGTRDKTNLSDTINIPTPDGVLYTNSEAIMGPFTTLTDTPSTYALGDAGKILAVNAAEDGVEFIENLIVTAPDLGRWRILVDNAGNLSTELE